MIAANASHEIRRALTSIYEIADEIILADTGSTDGTPELAKNEFGANVIKAPNPLVEGFEAARNASIRPAKGDWILWIDSDERLDRPANLMKYLRPSYLDAIRIKQHHFNTQPAMQVKIDKPCRLFRNRKGIKFFGMIHEHPEKNINEGPGPNLEISDVDIAHDGYLSEPTRRDKFWRNLPMLKADREKYPDRVLGRFLYMRDLIHLAQWSIEKSGQLSAEAIGNAQEVLQIYQNTFLTMGGHMMVDGLEYYNSALAILGTGYDFAWSLAAGNGNQMPGEIQRSKFASRDDYIAFTSKILEQQGVM
jgi:glycosyltransferase involved in cell wall biosynthesis